MIVRGLRSFSRVVILLGLLLFGSQVEASDTQTFNGRSLIVHAPTQLPAAGARALVIVLHGGLGNAERIADKQSESGLNMDDEADRNGFIVAYLNGTPVTRLTSARMFGWNAGGGCCGMSAQNNIDDVAYVSEAVADLVSRYGVDPSKVYGMGHSNGAMMVQRMVCETRVLAAVVAVSGPLNLENPSCPGARGRRVLAIHGARDENVPVTGGVGTKGLSHVAYQSEDSARRAFTAAGAEYRLQIVPDADHKLEHIDAAIKSAEGVTIARKATDFFGLSR